MAYATKDGQGFGNGNIRIFYNSGSLKAATRELVSQVQCGYRRENLKTELRRRRNKLKGN